MEGATLEDLLLPARVHSRWPLEESVASAIVVGLLEELAGAHARGEFHRDLSPKHIVLTGGRVTLKPYDGSTASAGYMSPEQAHGQPLEARSDLFAAGLLLFELVCGRAQSVSALALGELETPRAVNPKVSDGMTAVLERALKLEPKERFPSATEMAAALRLAVVPVAPETLHAWTQQFSRIESAAVLEHLLKSKPAPAPAEPSKPGTRRPGSLVMTALGVTGIFALTLGALQLIEHRAKVQLREYEASLRTCELMTDPPAAQIWLDGKPYKERAPTQLHLEPNREYVLELKSPNGAAVYRLKNHKKLSVRVQMGAAPLEEELWEGRPPQRPKPPAPKDDPAPAPAAAGDEAEEPANPGPEPASFDAENAPVRLTLTPEHEILIPEKLCRAAPKGTWRIIRAPMVYGVAYNVPHPNTTSSLKGYRQDASHWGQRDLTLLYLDKALGRVDRFPAQGENAEATTICPFALSDRSLETVSVPPTIELEKSHLETLTNSLVTVPLDGRFLVRSLPRAHRWRVKLDPVEAPYAVMVARLPDGTDVVRVLDEASVDVPPAAESIWFTIPVLQRADVKIQVNVEAR